MSNLLICKSGNRNDVTVTLPDINQTLKQPNNGDKGYMLQWEKFHW